MKLLRRHTNGSSEQRTGTFTGVVWVDPILRPTDGVVINDVFFTPGARTFWHRHERGQILRVNSGLGLICIEGAIPQLLQPGDHVWAEPGESHWHGGTLDCCLHHTAISLGETTWLDPVSEDDYRMPLE